MDRVEEIYDNLVQAPHPIKSLITYVITLEDRIAALESPGIQENGFTIEHASEFERSSGYYGELYATVGGVQYKWVFSDEGGYTEYKDKHWCRAAAIPRETDAAARTLAKKLRWLK